MKIITKQEEKEHYNATVKGGIAGGFGGLAIGLVGVLGASRRFAVIRHLTLPMKAFLVTSSATFGAIVTADKFSRKYEASRNPEGRYLEAAVQQRQEAEAAKSPLERFTDWGRENRYGIVAGSWVASMVLALGIVGRNPYLSTAQKIVQARVYAQGLTVAVLLASASFEIGDMRRSKGRWEESGDEASVQHNGQGSGDGNVEDDQWKDMMQAEEQKMKQREEEAHKQAVKSHNKKKHHQHGNEDGKQSNDSSKSTTTKNNSK